MMCSGRLAAAGKEPWLTVWCAPAGSLQLVRYQPPRLMPADRDITLEPGGTFRVRCEGNHPVTWNYSSLARVSRLLSSRLLTGFWNMLWKKLCIRIFICTTCTFPILCWGKNRTIISLINVIEHLHPWRYSALYYQGVLVDTRQLLISWQTIYVYSVNKQLERLQHNANKAVPHLDTMPRATPGR